MSASTKTLLPDWQETARARIKAHSLRINFARLFLILIIVMLHFRMEPMGPNNANAISKVHDFIRETFLRLPVPLLSIMSGYIFFATGAFQHAAKTVRAKMQSLVVPFLIFNIPLVFVIYAAQQNGMALENRIVLVGADLWQWAEALFAITQQPVNYPLYFLRDLFVVAMLGLLVGRFYARFTALTLVFIAVVAYTNLDGFFIIRNDVLLCFFLGGYLAIRNIDIEAFDKFGWIILGVILPALCFLFYYVFSDQRLLFRVAGGLAFWPAIGALLSVIPNQFAKAYSKYAFPIYLMHAPLIFAFLFADFGASPTWIGAAWWLLAPFIIAAIIIVFTLLVGRLAPSLANVALGGRIVGKA